MKTAVRIGITATATALLAAAGGTAANAATPHHSGPASQHAVFVQTDSPTGNAIVAFDRAADGTLTQAGTYATGGVGGQLGGSVVDHTASQDSVVRAGDSLFVTNAGSDSITSFRILGDRLIREQVVSSHGDFPVSLTVHGPYLYALNARSGGSVQGYLDVAGHLIALPTAHRELGLPTGAQEFTSTPAEVAFTPDGSRLVVSTKGSTSSFDVFDVRGLLGLSSKPVVTTVAGAVPFGFVFDRAGRIVATEAGTNSVATFALQRDDSLATVSTVATGQAATCWIATDGIHFWASNAGSGTLSQFSVAADGTVSGGSTTATDAGTVDAAVSPDGRFLYAQTGAAGILDEFSIGSNGTLTRIGSITVPGAVGAEGIALS